jgi:pimeloyl-ACP methyl ester carboxylesterase
MQIHGAKRQNSVGDGPAALLDGTAGKCWLLCLALVVFLLPASAPAQVSQERTPERTIDEIKVEAQARAERRNYPLIGLDPSDVRDALSGIKTRDADEWAANWSAIADRYVAKAEAATSADDKRANYLRAWRLYYFAQWPVASSPGKKAAYQKALDAFVKSAQSFNPPLEVVRIPFEGKEIVGYLRLPPATAAPAPLILAVSGLDSRKETMADSYNALIEHGIGYFAVDGPGTGQSPVKVSPTADRVLSKVIDYLGTRKEIDPKRIVMHGVSFGGYWGAKLAIVERDRLRGVVVQSPPVHNGFQADFLKTNLLGNREYLFDVVPAFMNVVENVENTDDLAREFPKLSLQNQGLLGKPTTSMLVIGGTRDTQAPIADLELLLNSGDVPKEAWINPKGGHLGREATGWTDPVIFRKVIMPWEIRMLKGE